MPVLYEKNMNKILDYDSENDIWQHHYFRVMTSMSGTIPEKEAATRKRILRYFGEFKLDTESYFSIRSNINYTLPGLEIIVTSILLFGVDFLTEQRTKNMFQGLEISMKRIDDSHLIIDFKNAEDCLGAINKLKIDGKPRFESPRQLMDQSNEGWVELKGYQEFIFERKLMARFLTNFDNKDTIFTAKQSYAFAYSQAKRRFMASLIEDLNEQRERNYRNYGQRVDNVQQHPRFKHEQKYRMDQRSRQKDYKRNTFHHQNQNDQRIQRGIFTRHNQNYIPRTNYNQNYIQKANIQNQNYSPRANMQNHNYVHRGNMKQNYLCCRNQGNYKPYRRFSQNKFTGSNRNYRQSESPKFSPNQSPDNKIVQANATFEKYLLQRKEKSDKTLILQADCEFIQPIKPLKKIIRFNEMTNDSQIDFTNFMKDLSLNDKSDLI